MATPQRNPVQQKPLVEISLDSVESAVAAQRGGAGRVELCTDLLQGGTTPSAGLIATVRNRMSIPLHVMIRPRASDFCYTKQEFEIMKRDILMAKQLGADGVVLGILIPDGRIDLKRTREAVEIAKPMTVTFHRAFDMTENLHEALESVIESGAARILTSGGESKAEDALATISALLRTARNRIAITVCGGVRESNVRRIVDETGAREVHVGHSGVQIPVVSAMQYRNEKVSMGTVAGHEYQHFIVSEERVRSLVRALD